MEFKIDTRDSYVRIAPIGEHLSVNMAAMIEEKAAQLAESSPGNALIDLSACQSADEAAFEALASWHESSYSEGRSLVFTGLQPAVMDAIKEAQLDGAINIAPTEIEGIDIISMEIIERELFDEES
jgi:anti-anti-sigma regulatory factor